MCIVHFYAARQSPAAVSCAMAAWRFGCQDCSWEWSLVTVGIIAVVLALLVLLAICAAAAADEDKTSCFCCCLLPLIVLIGVMFGLGLYSSKPPSQLPKSVTVSNQQCWNRCSQEGTTYFWCW